MRPLPQYRGQHVELARKGRVENRRAGHRIVRSMHAGRSGRMAALAGAPQGRRQTLRQTQPGDEHRIPGRVGEVLPAVADRDAHRAPDARPPDARHRRGAEGLRREHHLHRAHRRRDVDGSRRRHRGSRQGARRLQRQDGLRNPDPRRRGFRRFHPAVPTPREEVGLPPQMGAVDLHVGPQVRTGVPRTGMGRMEGQEVPARRNVVLGQLPRREHHAGGPELLAAGGADSRPVLQLHPAGIRGVQGGAAELDGHRQILPRADRQDAVLPELRQRGRQPAVHLDDGPRIRQEGQMDAVRPAGRLAAERLDGPGIHHAQEHRRDDRHAHRGSPGHVARHGRHASGRHPQRRGRVRETPVPHALAHQVREQGAPERQGLHALMRPEVTGPPTAGTLAGKAAFGPQFRP